MPDMKSLSFGYSKRSGSPNVLKIETPGGMVIITRGLHESKTGRERIRIDIAADGARFSGETPWWFIPADSGRNGSVGWLEKETK